MANDEYEIESKGPCPDCGERLLCETDVRKLLNELAIDQEAQEGQLRLLNRRLSDTGEREGNSDNTGDADG